MFIVLGVFCRMMLANGLLFSHNDKDFTFMPSFHFDLNDLQDGTPSSVVRSLLGLQKSVEQLSSQLVGGGLVNVELCVVYWSCL